MLYQLSSLSSALINITLLMYWYAIKMSKEVLDAYTIIIEAIVTILCIYYIWSSSAHGTKHPEAHRIQISTFVATMHWPNMKSIASATDFYTCISI